jgi:hypothetical protein
VLAESAEARAPAVRNPHRATTRQACTLKSEAFDYTLFTPGCHTVLFKLSRA